MGYDDDELHIRYLGAEYNISRFRKFHPGGSNTLSIFKGSDVTKQLIETNHSPAAYNLLEEYRVDNKNEGPPSDEDDLVDWSQSLYKQVGQLGEHYHSWVLKPVDRQARLFDSNLLEELTLTRQWYVVPLVWVPVFIGLIYVTHLRLAKVTDSQEYSTHRWLFHLKPPDNSPLLISLHFGLHGLHHKVPFDERRLLFPPVPASVAAFLMYCVYSAVLPPWAASSVGAGTLAGYVIYDLIHYYLHYGSPKEGTYLYYMKRYHNQHHFVHHNNGFGISNNVWDKIFNTALTLKTLKFNMKW